MRPILFFYVPALLLAPLLPVGNCAAATLRGTVRDARTAETIGYVNIQVTGVARDGERVLRGIMALADGRYLIARIPSGEYRVTFTRVGYRTREDTLRITHGENYSLDVVLTGQPVGMPPIIVEGDRYRGTRDVQPGFVDVRSEDLADLPGILENDPIRALQLLPGVGAASDFSSGLYIRGGGPDQTLVLFDNVTVYNPSHAFGFFSTFNGDALGNIRLFKGAYPAQFGGRLGAVLEVDSRQPNRKHVRGNATLSTIAGRLRLEGPIGGGAWMVAARRTYLEPLLDVLRKRNNEIPAYYFYDVNVLVTLPAAGGTATLSGYTGRDRLNLSLDADNALAFDWGNALGAIKWHRAWSDRALLELRASASEYTSGSSARALTTPVEISNGITDASFGADLTVDAGAGHQLGAGLLASRFDARYRETFNAVDQVDYRRRPVEVAAYTEDKWTVSARTVVRGGVRVRYIRDGRRWLAEPRISAGKRLGSRWRARIGGGVYHQVLQLVTTEGLSAVDFYVPTDRSVDAARSWQATAGLEFDPDAAHAIRVQGYYTGLTDLLTLDNDLAAGTPIAQTADVFYPGGRGYSSGIELLLRRRRGSLSGWVGYTLGWTRRRWSALNQGKTFPPKFDRLHDVKVALSYHPGKWTLGGAFVYGSGQAFTPAASRYSLRNPATDTFDQDARLLPASRNSARLLPYNRLDVSVARSFTIGGLGAEWSLQVFNLYSRRNEWFVNYSTNDAGKVDAKVIHMLPIIPSLGLRINF